jgi:hypothetical protein
MLPYRNCESVGREALALSYDALERGEPRACGATELEWAGREFPATRDALRRERRADHPDQLHEALAAEGWE